MEPIVRKIDHVFVPVTDPAPLFDLFTVGLGLPVAWPISDYGAFRSGGVCFGNCNVEIVTGSGFEYFEPWLPAAVRGVAFEPAVAMPALESSLDARGLPHSPVTPHAEQWANVYLGGMIGRGAIAFACEYRSLSVPRGDAGTLLLHQHGGGPLGITGIDELFAGVVDYDKAHARWSAFLAPHPSNAPGRWSIGPGPRFRLTSASRDAVHGIAVRVRSLDVARSALMERGLLGNVKRHSVGLHYPATYGLDVWFVEQE